ncbi:MAG: endo-1,4-beta-xylanase [Treponema sp.]|nr:endo-1,4-beta-xylanase [Treponema sp.]
MSGKIADIPALKEKYKSFFYVGNVVSPEDLGGARFEVLKKHFDVLTAENAMKPMHIQAEPGIFTFEIADRLVNAVLEAGLKVHGHTLAWHQQSPEWQNREGIGRDEAIENLVTHAGTVAGHFRGRVISWDVLNEAIIDGPPNPGDWRASLRQTPWLKAIGVDHIEMLFRAAREADPDAMLYYNDYNEDYQDKALAIYNMVRELNEKNPDVLGRPLIDGIGMQGHYLLNTDIKNVTASLERFLSLGLEVSITEMDIRAGDNHVLTEEQELRQGVLYAQIFALCRKYPGKFVRTTLWGLDDASSWRSQQNPLLFDGNLRPKKAFFGALDPEAFLAEHGGVRVAREALQAQARRGSPGLDADDPAWQTAPVLSVNQYLMAWQGAYGNARVLWDDRYLYVNVAVSNAEMNKANPVPQEQDSVEIYIDEGNHKALQMQADDGLFRVSFANEQSCVPASLAGDGGLESAAVVSGDSAKSYRVVAKIPFRTIKPREGAVIGFDLQVNGASAQGIRQSIAVWNDTSGNSWQNPSGYGLLRLSN